MFFGKQHVVVGKSSFGRTLIFKDSEGNAVAFVGLSFEESAQIAKELTS